MDTTKTLFGMGMLGAAADFVADGFQSLRNMLMSTTPIRNYRTYGPRASDRPTHTKNVFKKWVEGPPHNHFFWVRDKATGKRMKKLVQTPTRVATYDMDAIRAHKKLYARTHNAKGEIAR